MRLACVLLALTALSLCAQSDAALRAYLLDEYKTSDLQYVSARVDLNGDGKEEIIVYMTGRDFCGSGGCAFHVLTQRGASLVEVPVGPLEVHLPIRVLGKNSLGLVLGGGGVQRFEVAFTFDKNLRVSDDVRRSQQLPGRILIGDDAFDKAKPLK